MFGFIRSTLSHPLLVFLVVVSFCLHLFFPDLFYLLMHASPVVASTLVLLGTLLFYGHEKAHHHESEIGEESFLVNNMIINENRKLGSAIDNGLSRGNKGELSNRKPFLVNRYGPLQSFEMGNDKMSSGDRSRRSSVDSLRNSPRPFDEDNKGWESGSSLSGSLADINLLLDELGPLSESEVPFPLVSTDAASDHSLESGDYGHETGDFDDDEDIEVKDDEGDSVLTWTEYDQRNLMNLGSSEVERNQFLENLIVRQKALKNMRMMAERNIAKNHFDHPYHTQEHNLGFANSIMIPRRNPFDLPHDPSDKKFDRVGPTFQSGYVPLRTNEPVGLRRMSYDSGPSTLGSYSIPERVPIDTKPSGSHRTSDISEFLIQRRRFTEDKGNLKLHKVALREGKRDDKNNKSNVIGAKTGYEEKTSGIPSSPAYFDVTDDINNGDNDNEEEDYSTPMVQDSKEPQIEDSNVGYSAKGNAEGKLPKRPSQAHEGIKAWLTGWKA